MFKPVIAGSWFCVKDDTWLVNKEDNCDVNKFNIFIDDTDDGISHLHLSSDERIELAKKSIEYNIKNYSEIYSNFNI